MTAFAVPLTNIFALLGAGQTVPNGFGVGPFGAQSASPFASLVTPVVSNGFGVQLREGENEIADTGAMPVSTFLKTAKANLAAAQKAAAEKAEDLSSPELLLSDLLSINWDDVKAGDTVTLPNGWTLTAAEDSVFTLENSAANILVPSFTKAQLDAMAQKAGLPVRDQAVSSMLASPAQDATTGEDEVQVSIKEKQKSADAPPAAKTGSNVTNPDPSVLADNQVRSNSSSATVATALNTSMRMGNSNNVPGAKPVVFTPSQRIDHFFSADLALPGFVDPLSESLGDNGGLGFGQNGAFYQQLGLRAAGNGALSSAHSMPVSQLQIVIQKLAERGDTRSLTVQLDPTELGRVQVELSTGRDKILKANILVEKPEAYALLQRDMGSLEKALQNAGISLDGDHVSLDLADQGDGQGSGFAQQAFADLADERRHNEQPAVLHLDDVLSLPARAADAIPLSPLHSAALYGVNITV